MKQLFNTAILSLLVFFSLRAQTYLDSQFEFAEDLFSQEQYFDSVTELKRLLFFDKSGTFNFSANELIGRSFKMGAKYSEAIYHFTMAEINASSVDDLFNMKTEIIRCNILRGTTDRAVKLLDSLKADERFTARASEINYWLGWAYIFSDEWEDAAISFKGAGSVELEKLCLETEDKLYSVNLAKIISFIVPGAGQLYTGHYLSGLMSLGWNVLWGYLTINAFVNDRILDGVLIANFLWLRFYRGNIENAEKFALKKNLEITNKTLRYLQYNYGGVNP